MVRDFEIALGETGSKKEKELYSKISKFLSASLGRPVDLEAVFSVVDSVINCSPDRLGIAALYQAFDYLQGKFGNILDPLESKGFEPPAKDDIQIAVELRNRFQDFVRTKCEIHEASLGLIEPAYGALFDLISDHVIGGGNAGKTQDSKFLCYFHNKL